MVLKDMGPDPVLERVNLIFEINEDRVYLDDIEKNYLFWVLRNRCKNMYNTLCQKLLKVTQR